MSPRCRAEAPTNLYAFRFRDFCPTVGWWVGEEPVDYANGGTPFGFFARGDAAPDAT